MIRFRERFDFSYAFDPTLHPATVSGSFEGLRNGDLITDLSAIKLFVNGVAVNAGGTIYTSFSNHVSISGDNNEFDFLDADWIHGQAYHVMFSGTRNDLGRNVRLIQGQPVPVIADRELAVRNGYGQYDSTRWHVTSTTAVPEPETYALGLAGLAIIGVMVKRRK